MKRNIPIAVNTFCYVSLLVLLGVTAIYAPYLDNKIPIPFIWYALSNGAVSALLTIVFLTDVIINECAGWLRLTLFLVTLYASVTALSIAFYIVDPTNIFQILTMLVMIALIFLAVFFTNHFSYKQQEKELAKKLQEFNDSLDD